MSDYHVSQGHKSDYSIAYSGNDQVQIIQNGPDCIHWLIVREGSIEQKIALSLSTLILLSKAVAVHPVFKRIVAEMEKNGDTKK